MMKTPEHSRLNLPRYTSYPTAPHFHAGVGAERYTQWLGELGPAQPLSLYVHVPFCKQLCWFCGCHTRIVNHYEPVARYLTLLEQEVSIIRSHLPASNAVEHVHFGGGSPSMVAAEDFIRFMDHLRREFLFSEDAEVAIEIDPRTLDMSKADAYARSGVNRASIGVQDFAPEVQQAINRVQPYEEVKAKLAMLRDRGISALNIDLIYGLPHQTVASIRDTIAQAVSLTPDRLSLFGYAHVPWVKKHQRLIPEDTLPTPEMRQAMYEEASELLKQAGYAAIGLDHFALPDDPLTQAMRRGELRRNFQGYTTDHAEALIGFGVSAISSLPQGHMQNTSDIKSYALAVKAGNIPVTRGYALSNDDRLRRAVIMSLMCHLQAELPDALLPERESLALYVAGGMVELSGNTLRIKEESRPLLRVIASLFDAYLPQAAHRYSQAV